MPNKMTSEERFYLNSSQSIELKPISHKKGMNGWMNDEWAGTHLVAILESMTIGHFLFPNVKR